MTHHLPRNHNTTTQDRQTNTETTTQLRKTNNEHRNHNTTTQDQQRTQKPQHNYTRPTTNTETTTQLHKTNNEHRNHNTTTQSPMQTNASRSCGVGTTRSARVTEIKNNIGTVFVWVSNREVCLC
jgi:hypothetical protein